jgi:hypothetical protein
MHTSNVSPSNCQALSAADQEIISTAFNFLFDCLLKLYLSDDAIYALPLDFGRWHVEYDSSSNSLYWQTHDDCEDWELTDLLGERNFHSRHAFDVAVKLHKRNASPSTLALIKDIHAAYSREQSSLRRYADKNKKECTARYNAELRRRFSKAA